MRIISWNINNKVSLWKDVASLDADVALLQEAPYPPSNISSQIKILSDDPWQTAKGRMGKVRPWRTTIVGLSDEVKVVGRSTKSMGYSSPDDFLVSRFGTLTVAEVILKQSSETFTLISMYSVWEKPDISTSQNWIIADASVHRLISDISALIGKQRGHKIIAAGDLNIVYGYGELGSTYWKERYDSVFSRMKALGVSFAGPQYPDGGVQANPWPKELPRDSLNVPTYRTRRDKPKTALRQLDFVFASDALHKRMSVCALNTEEDWGPSDHCRILIEIE